MSPHRWPANTPVTLRANPAITGRTTVVTARDGRRFVKIHQDHGGDAGWANADVWMLGAGKWQTRCVDCGQDYRSTPATFGDGFCPACDRSDRPNSTADETRSISGSLYGARTPRATVEPVTVPPGEKFEDPFGEAK